MSEMVWDYKDLLVLMSLADNGMLDVVSMRSGLSLVRFDNVKCDCRFPVWFCGLPNTDRGRAWMEKLCDNLQCDVWNSRNNLAGTKSAGYLVKRGLDGIPFDNFIG